MDLSTITVADFKAQFVRGFPYLPVWVAGSYNAGELVYYTPTRLFYTAKTNGVNSIPTTAADWTVTAGATDDYVQDSDITSAFAEAKVNFNQSLFDDDATIKMAYLYLTAFYLVNDLRAAAAGMGGTGSFPVSSRTVGSVSESYEIPQAYKDSALLAQYTSNAYGLKYASFILPLLIGNVNAVWGGTNA